MVMVAAFVEHFREFLRCDFASFVEVEFREGRFRLLLRHVGADLPELGEAHVPIAVCVEGLESKATFGFLRDKVGVRQFAIRIAIVILEQLDDFRPKMHFQSELVIPSLFCARKN